MGTITSGVGLISGINTGQIISGLIGIESQPITLLQNRITSTSNQKTAYTDLATALLTLQTTGELLEKPQTFQAATTTSSDPSILTATASPGASVGTYNLQVAQLVTTQQTVSNGFTDTTTSPVGAGTITLEEGGGEINSTTPLSALNGGAGISRGQFRITDRSGNTAVVDTTNAVTVDDVLKKINTSLGVSVKASISGDKIVLTDTTGKTTNSLSVTDLGTGTSAASLGIAGTAGTGAPTVLTGTDINYLATGTSLNQLNDGRGVRVGTSGDLSITTKSGATVNVNLATAKTVGDVLNAINTAAGGKVVASVVSGANGITLTDKTVGLSTFKVTNAAGSNAATDLGLTSTASGATITGGQVLAGIDTVLLSSLRGGQGLSLGTFKITNRAGTAKNVNLAGLSTVQDVINAINASGASVTASLKSSGNGIQLVDNSGGTGNLTIADTTGTSAAQLGITGTFATSQTSVQGADLQRQWVTNSTQLSTLNGGNGIGKGKITITNAAGQTTTVDLSGSTINTVSDVLSQINNKGLAGVTASINSAGNGIVINDTSTGAGKLTIADVDSTTAADLNIAGKATTNSINGAYEKTITVGPNDTLASVQAAINAANFGVRATIINDGSATSPYRLSLTAQNSGTAGRVVIDTGTTGLATTNLVTAQDAAVFLGSGNSANPLLVTSSSNQVTGIINGVTLSLVGVSTGAVQLSVTNDPDSIVTQLSNFTTEFNDLADAISTLTSYDTTTNTAGLLLGDPTVATIQNDMYDMLNKVVNTGGKYKVISDVGITVGDGAKLSFDEDTFRAAFATDANSVQNLFSATQTVTAADGTTTTNKLGLGYSIDTAMGQLIDPVSGIVTLENSSLDAEVSNFQDQITQLNAVIANKQSLLQEQFANMEEVLANLQGQQTALNSLSGITTSSSSSSSSSKSSG